MYIADHVARAERIEETNTRLHLSDDHEMVLWNCVHVATHYFNAALHAVQVTEERNDYPASEAYYYYVRSDAGSGWKLVRAPLGDIIHSHMPFSPVPSLPTEPEGDLLSMLTDLRQIESYRPKYVRGDEPYEISDGIACMKACERIKHLALRLVASLSEGV